MSSLPIRRLWGAGVLLESLIERAERRLDGAPAIVASRSSRPGLFERLARPEWPLAAPRTASTVSPAPRAAVATPAPRAAVATPAPRQAVAAAPSHPTSPPRTGEDLEPSADGACRDLLALSAMIRERDGVSPLEALRRAHRDFPKLSSAARLGDNPPRDIPPREVPEPAALRSASGGPADIMAAAKLIQVRDRCDFRTAMSRAHKEHPALSEKARTLGVPAVAH